MVGICPHCESENVEYGNSRLEGDSMGYEMTCQNCGKEFIEWYDLVYSETVEKEI